MPGGRSEERVIFTLLRDPEWTGFNRIPPNAPAETKRSRSYNRDTKPAST